MSLPLFCYGTLRDADLRAAVLGGAAAGLRAEPAILPGYRAASAAAGAYPHLAAAAGGRLPGVLLNGLDEAAMARLSAYEGAEYRLVVVEAVPAQDAAPRQALVFAPVEPPAKDAPDWRFEEWLAREGGHRRAAAAAMGALYDAEAARGDTAADGDALSALEEYWPDVLGEASKAAGAPGPIARAFGGPFGRADVEEIACDRVYELYFKLDHFRLRHRRHLAPDTFCEPIDRAVFRVGEAVLVLPYDPVSDRVLLIQQFRAGAYAAGDPSPWSVEVVAGRVDPPAPGETEDPQTATARREAMEEAGLSLGRLERFDIGYASPGATDETLTLFIAEADLPATADGAPALGGAFGLEEEGEDIRVFTLSLDDALEALEAGEIRNLPAAMALLRLARRRRRLQLLWTS